MLYLKGMPNLIDFDERIFLHAIRFCIIILCLKYTLIFLPKEIIAEILMMQSQPAITCPKLHYNKL